MPKAKQPDYATLRKLWYKKLRKTKSKEYPDGFKDIELRNGKLHASSYDLARERAGIQYGGLEAKAEYHRLASWFLYEHKFESKLEEAVWEYHLNGLSVRDITETLRKAKIKSTNRDFVNKLIMKLKALMIERYIGPKRGL